MCYFLKILPSDELNMIAEPFQLYSPASNADWHLKCFWEMEIPGKCLESGYFKNFYIYYGQFIAI
jgi:hypothetical protein